MSYTLDIYLGRVKPIPRLFDFALFVAFFTQLVAGPILRTSQLVPQFETPRKATLDQFVWGLTLMTLGLFEKVVLADGALAPSADAVFGAATPVGALDAWAGVLAFSGQIFCDFAGYATIAVGAAMCLGFCIPDNFNQPYAAIGFSDFWRRWHISLSTWLRDYLYIPLGGNCLGSQRRPGNPKLAIELSAATRRRLGLGIQPNWVMATEVNSFYWPGPDLRPTPDGLYAYGELPAAVFEALKQKILGAGTAASVVARSE